MARLIGEWVQLTWRPRVWPGASDAMRSEFRRCLPEDHRASDPGARARVQDVDVTSLIMPDMA